MTLLYRSFPRSLRNYFLSEVKFLFVCFKDFIYLFLERGEGKEKERERNINMWLLLMHPPLGTQPTTQACALTGNRTGNPLIYRSVLTPLWYTSQGPSAQIFMVRNWTCLHIENHLLSHGNMSH